MAPVNVHAPDPDDPAGMAFVFGAGMVDPRPGDRPNQPMALVQSWEPTSRLWWDLGLRYHPELATKWVVGGGQFSVGRITKERPDKLHTTAEEGAAEVIDYISEHYPEYAENLKRIKEVGSEAERKSLIAEFEKEIGKLAGLIKFVSQKPGG